MELLDKSLLFLTVLQITSLQCMPSNVNAKPLQNRAKRISAFRPSAINSMSKAYEIPTAITPSKGEKKSSNLLTKILKEAKTKYGDIAKDTSEPLPKSFGTTPQPYCFKDVGTFPEVEYPMLVADTWMPNYWKRLPTPQRQTNSKRPKEKDEPVCIKPSNKAIEKAVRALIKARENKKGAQHSPQSSYSTDFGPPPLNIPENVTPEYADLIIPTATTPMPPMGLKTDNDKTPYTDQDIPSDGLPVVDEVPPQPADDTSTDPVRGLSNSPTKELTDPVGIQPNSPSNTSIDPVEGLPDLPAKALANPTGVLPDSTGDTLTDPVEELSGSPTTVLTDPVGIPPDSMPTDPVKGLPNSPTEALTDPLGVLPDDDPFTDPVGGLSESPADLSAMEPIPSFITSNEYDMTTMPPDIIAFDITAQKIEPEDVTTKLSPEDWTEFILI